MPYLLGAGPAAAAEFPAAEKVSGELWWVGREGLAGLDEFEGVDKQYCEST